MIKQHEYPSQLLHNTTRPKGSPIKKSTGHIGHKTLCTEPVNPERVRRGAPARLVLKELSYSNVSRDSG